MYSEFWFPLFQKSQVKLLCQYGRQHFYSYFLNRSENSAIYLPIILNQVFGTQKNRLIETALLSTHNKCFDQKFE